MKAAIYCRVSTEGQEQEGTSLQTQMQACLDYCHEKGYEVSHRSSVNIQGIIPVDLVTIEQTSA